MKRNISFITAVLAGVFLVTGVAVHHVNAQANTQQDTRSATEIIWSGLWAGANLKVNGTKNTPANGNTTKPAAGTPALPTAGAYVALGDSVAAGLGLPARSVSPSETRCGRSTQAYPYSVAQAAGLPLVHIACSGATAGDLNTVQRGGGPNQPAQIARAFSGGSPQFISITAGANDARWADLILICYVRDCTTRTVTTTANVALKAMQHKLNYALADIRTRSHGTPPTVVVTGYYNPVSAACTNATSNVTAAEIAWITAEVAALNTTIQQAVSAYSFARYAPVDFTGHDICASDSWVQGLDSSAPFHPTAQGQAAIARSVLGAIGR